MSHRARIHPECLARLPDGAGLYSRRSHFGAPHSGGFDALAIVLFSVITCQAEAADGKLASQNVCHCVPYDERPNATENFAPASWLRSHYTPPHWFAGLTCRPFEERVALVGNVSFVATKSYASNLTCSWVIHPKCPQPCAIVATITNIDLETGARKCSSFGF